MTLLLAALFFVPSLACADDPHLVLAATNWAPIMGERMENGGYLTEVVTTTFKRAGYSVDIRWVPWKRALVISKQGIYDGIIAASYTKDRHPYFNATDPIVSDDFAYFGLTHRHQGHDPLLQLKPMTVGILRGAAIMSDLEKNKNITIAQSNNHNQNIRKLLAKRIDFMLGSRTHIQHILDNKFTEQQKSISVIEPIYRKNQYHLLFSKLHPEHAIIVSNFNRAFKQMREEGVVDKIRRKHNLDQAVLPLPKNKKIHL